VLQDKWIVLTSNHARHILALQQRLKSAVRECILTLLTVWNTALLIRCVNSPMALDLMEAGTMPIQHLPTIAAISAAMIQNAQLHHMLQRTRNVTSKPIMCKLLIV
jgi:hypothetical protein